VPPFSLLLDVVPDPVYGPNCFISLIVKAVWVINRQSRHLA